MALSERNRHDLYEAARQHLGEEVAEALMELLPPVGWADVATKQDLDHVVALLRTELHAEIAELRGEVRGELYSLEARLTDKLVTQIAAQTRTLTLAFVGSMVTITGLAFGAARLAA